MQPARDSLPPDVLLVPILRPTLDEQGELSGEVQVVLSQAPDGAVVAEAYSSPRHLASARGNLQPWVAVRRQRLGALLDRHNVSTLLVDAGSPEGYELGSDGSRTPLPEALRGVPGADATTEEAPDATA
jgi:hypothetical protein